MFRVHSLAWPVESAFAVSDRWTERALTRVTPIGDAHAPRLKTAQSPSTVRRRVAMSIARAAHIVASMAQHTRAVRSTILPYDARTGRHVPWLTGRGEVAFRPRLIGRGNRAA